MGIKKEKKIKIGKKELEKLRKSKKHYIPKTFYGFGRNFKRCENCQWHKDSKGAIVSKNFVFCSYRNVFVNKKSELLCFNVQPLQSYLNPITGKILLC